MTTRYRTVDVDGINVFFREAGAADAPALLLLHGFPTSAHMFRELIPALADRLSGFSFSDTPDRANFKYITGHRLVSASPYVIRSGSPP
jgi:pimeloyl-ACP methyl ester carboxylesterase